MYAHSGKDGKLGGLRLTGMTSERAKAQADTCESYLVVRYGLKMEPVSTMVAVRPRRRSQDFIANSESRKRLVYGIQRLTSLAKDLRVESSRAAALTLPTYSTVVCALQIRVAFLLGRPAKRLAFFVVYVCRFCWRRSR